MIFESISWQQFVIATSAIMIAYYLVVLFTMYRHDIRNLLNRKSSHPETQPDSPLHDNLMGSAINPDSHHIADSSQLIFAPQTESDDTKLKSKEEEVLLQSITALREEITILMDTVSGREEATSLMETLLSRYPHLASTEHRNDITVFIYTLFREKNFHISLHDINTWWPQNQ